MGQSKNRQKWLVASAGSLTVLYSVLVLGYVATSSDLRLRCLLTDDRPTTADTVGIKIQDMRDLECDGTPPKGTPPERGDILIRIGDTPVNTFLDFARALDALRNAPIPAGGQLHVNSDPSELEGLPTLVNVGRGQRLIEIEFEHPGTKQRQRSWLFVQPLPLSEIILPFIWFLLQLGIFVVSALAVWHRPFDRQAWLFYVLCIVTLCAFVGGYHWWIIGASFWLNLPFVACAVLLPVVLLHFFLIFPQPKPLMTRRRTWIVWAAYTVPVLTILAMVAILVVCRWLDSSVPAERTTILQAFTLLRDLIYGYMVFAALCFALTLVAVAHGLRTTRDVIERNQLKWLLLAGVIAAVFVGYTLWLALSDRVGFALGRAQVPMFLASLSFMLAYAVSIVRFKLMLVGQVISKGMVYYAASCGVTVAYGVAIAAGSMSVVFLNKTMSRQQASQQALFVAVIVTLVVILLLWLRDRFQRIIDRRFYREKYQLDKALQGMNRAVSHIVDRQSLAQHMLTSCRDVLGTRGAALYLRNASRGTFELIAAEDTEDLPLQVTAEATFVETLKRDSTLQRVTPSVRGATSPAQTILRMLQADLLHALESDDDIAGLVALGGKKSGASYTAEDVTFLNALGQITSVALHSVKVHQDVSRLNDELQLKVDRIAEQQRQIAMMQAELTGPELDSSTQQKPSEFRRDSIKGDSPAIRRVLETVRKVATSESSVLIRGASGTGKELLAQAIHDNSPRQSGPLVQVHCAALSASLLESELFGHVKGAFTGAHRDRIGRFETANGGTLFLDEIGDISLETQIKLLRVLQGSAFEPVGSTRTVRVDVRLITATHQDLKKLISMGRFREDLFYRLNVVSIGLPSLKERKEDIFELAMHFLKLSAQRLGRRITHIDDDAVEALKQHDWPGNIRELENVIERAVVLTDGDKITAGDLPPELALPSPVSQLPAHLVEAKPVRSEVSMASSARVSQKQHTARDASGERETLYAALRQCDGNKAEAARLLGIPRSTYYSKLKKHQLG